MFISVDLPAPFSPSRAWIWPGSTVRSMWSLATRAPNRLVMPLSSSLTVRPPSLKRPPQLVGWLGEVILMEPLMIPCFSWSSSLWREEGTCDWKL